MADPVDSKPDKLVFNRTVTLRDSWAEVTGCGGLRIRNRCAPPRSSQDRRSQEPLGEGRRPHLATRAPTTPGPRASTTSSWRYPAWLRLEASVLAQDDELMDLFRVGSPHVGDAAALAKWVVNEVPRVSEGRSVDELPFGGAELGRLVDLVSSGVVSGRAAKDVLGVLAAEGRGPGRRHRRAGALVG